MTFAKTKQFYNKNQFIIRTDEGVVFQSYDSVIAIYKNGVLTLGCDWDYSNTTRKHLYLFIDEYVSISELYYLSNEKNKRLFIQKLIDKKIIKFDRGLY